ADFGITEIEPRGLQIRLRLRNRGRGFVNVCSEHAQLLTCGSERSLRRCHGVPPDLGRVFFLRFAGSRNAKEQGCDTAQRPTSRNWLGLPWHQGLRRPAGSPTPVTRTWRANWPASLCAG